MSSYSEGFGLAMVEAALVHKPIVCSDIPSFHEIFEENEVAFFELDNIDSLLTAIKKINNDLNSYSKLSYNKAYKFFTDKIMALNHYKYYSKHLKQ